MSAFTIIAIAMYMRFDWDIKDYVRQLQAQLLWTGPMILLAGSVISLLVSMLGCYATIQEHPRLLATVCSGASHVSFHCMSFAFPTRVALASVPSENAY